MAVIRKMGKKWQVIIRRKDHPQLSKCFISKEAAREWARDTEVNIERGLYANLKAAMGMSLKTLLESYREHVTPTKRGSEEESYKIGKLIKHELTKVSIARLTVLKIKNFQKELSISCKPSTINKYVSLIKMALEYAVNDLDIYSPKNVAGQVKRLKEPEPSGEVISEEEERKLIEASYKSKAYWIRAALIMGIDCGARRSEILRMNIKDIDRINKTAILRNTKNGEDRVIGLTNRAIQELLKLPPTPAGQLFVCSHDTFMFYWKQLRKWAGVNKTFHSSRATFATRAAKKGWNHLDIAAQTGHKDLNVLKKHYVELDAQYLSKKMESSNT